MDDITGLAGCVPLRLAPIATVSRTYHHGMEGLRLGKDSGGWGREMT
jgi:hypothetical protein